MGKFNPLLILNYIAEALIYPYRILKAGSADKYVAQASANTDGLMGISTPSGPSYAIDERIDVVKAGLAEVEYGGVVTRGDYLTSDANGKAITITAAMLLAGAVNSIGVAEESGVSGDIGSVNVFACKLSRYDGVTASAAELNLNDGASSANTTASVVAVLDANKDLETAAHIGMAAAGVTAAEYGNGGKHRTVLTVATTLPVIAGGANLAVGKLLYTLPAGAVVINKAYMSLAITQANGNINADTPDGGLGTVIGAGVVATLDGTPTFENIITGQTFADCNGTAKVKTANPTAGVPIIVEAADAHTVHFNVADGWAANGDAGAALAGTVVIDWEFMN